MAVRAAALPLSQESVSVQRSVWHRFAANRRIRFGAMLLAVIVFAALAAPLLAHTNPRTPHPERNNLPPLSTAGRFALLGTDSLGRDIWSRILYGARVSLLTGVAAASVALVIGIPFGLLAGFFGGLADTIIMRWVDIQLAIPFFLLAITIAALFGPGLFNVIVLLGVTNWVGYTRVTRAQVLQVRELPYVEAARSVGADSRTVLLRHVLPNIWTPILILASQQIGALIIAESSLTFLGIGVPPEIPTWGGMIANGRSYLSTAWWISTMPGIALTLAVVAVYFVGDGMRDVLDPRLRR